MYSNIDEVKGLQGIFSLCFFVGKLASLKSTAAKLFPAQIQHPAPCHLLTLPTMHRPLAPLPFPNVPSRLIHSSGFSSDNDSKQTSIISQAPSYVAKEKNSPLWDHSNHSRNRRPISVSTADSPKHAAKALLNKYAADRSAWYDQMQTPQCKNRKSRMVSAQKEKELSMASQVSSADHGSGQRGACGFYFPGASQTRILIFIIPHRPLQLIKQRV